MSVLALLIFIFFFVVLDLSFLNVWYLCCMVQTVFAPSGPLLYLFFSETGIYLLKNLTSMCGIYLFIKNMYFAFQVMDHAPTLHLQGKILLASNRMSDI